LCWRGRKTLLNQSINQKSKDDTVTILMHYFPAADADVCNCQWNRFFDFHGQDKTIMCPEARNGAFSSIPVRVKRWRLQLETYISTNTRPGPTSH